jgi:chlorobactene glucosyltransferase
VDLLLIAAGACGWLLSGVWAWRCLRGLRAERRYPRVPTRPAPPGAPPASVLVAARNEEANIAACLEELLAQDYPSFEVLAIDDGSSDRTGALIEEARRRDGRLRALRASPTPEGWTGKNWALHLAAQEARGEWLLFTDADTRHGPQALSSAVARARERGLHLLTLVPRALHGSLWERALQPAAMACLGRWFPLERVNDPSDPLAFANGQFLLLSREAYRALGGHQAVRGEFLEDVALARAAKASGLRLEWALGKRLMGVRMYDTLPRALRGWRRIFLHAFERRRGVLALKALDLALSSVLPFALLLALAAAGPPETAAQPAWSLALVGAGCAAGLVWLFAAKAHSLVGEKRGFFILHPLAAAVLTGVLLAAVEAAWSRRPTRWR